MKPTAQRTMLALLFIALAGASSALAQDDKKARVELKRVTLNKVDFSKRSADATVYVEIKNPGSAFKVKDVRYRLKLNGQYAAQGQYKKQIKVPAASTVIIDVPITVNLLALPASTLSTVSEGFTIRYDLETQFTVPIFAFWVHKVKTTFSGDLPLGSMLMALPAKLKDQLVSKP